MTIVLLITIVIAIAALGLYVWLLRRVGPAPPAEPFDGDVYQVGAGAIVERGPARPQFSVVAMHGFMEDFRYFAELYDRPEVQFIGVLSGDYHLPIAGARPRQPPWAEAPRAPVGTIRHDAELLCQALAQLARGDRVRVHGHSRGGAVVTEAAVLRADLFEGVEVVLEAPVLPGGRPFKPLPGLVYALLPLLMPLWRLRPINPTNIGAWGRLNIPRKRQLIEALPFTPRRVSTMLTNLRDMDRWMQETDPTVLDNLPRGVVLVPKKDRVLEPAAMEAAARRAGHLETVLLPGCSHFVRFDRPEAFPALTSEQPRKVVR